MSKDSSAKYYQKNKKFFKKELVKGIKILLKNKQRKKRQYGCERYKNLPEGEKQELVQYKTNL